MKHNVEQELKGEVLIYVLTINKTQALAKNDLSIDFISAGETLNSCFNQWEPSAAAGG